MRASFPVDSPGGHRVCTPARGYYLAVHDARRRPLRAVCRNRLTVRSASRLRCCQSLVAAAISDAAADCCIVACEEARSLSGAPAAPSRDATSAFS